MQQSSDLMNFSSCKLLCVEPDAGGDGVLVIKV